MATSGARGQQSLEIIFKDFSQNIELVLTQIKGGEVIKEDSDSFSSDQFWNGVDGIFKRMSVEATKLSLAFSKTPFPSPKNTDAMVTEMEKAMLSLTSIFFTLPLTQGKVLRKHFQSSVVQVLECLHSFAGSLSKCAESSDGSQRLTWTGCVWEATDFKLFKDNKSSALKELSNTEELVQDALGEIEEAKESDGQMEMMILGEEEDDDESGEAPSWSDQDKSVVDACSGLVKVTKTTAKKCCQCAQKKGAVSSREEVAVLDRLVDLADQISPRVDQFVCGIYAPINYVELKSNARHLADLVEEVLQFLRTSSLTDNSDETWLDFLQTAVAHNWDKLGKSTLPDQGHG